MSIQLAPAEMATIDDDILHDLLNELRRTGEDDGLLDDVQDELERRTDIEMMKHAPSWYRRPAAEPIIDGTIGWVFTS